MSGFTEPFKFYVLPDEATIRTAMTSGLIVFDTNVLLSAYRFAPEAREELLSALGTIADRIWVPNRVAEEFHKRRLGVISDYDAAYLPVIDALSEIQEKLNDELEPKIAQLANRAALSDLQRSELIGLVSGSTQSAALTAENLRRAHGLADLRGEDPILARFQQLFDGKTGPALNEQDLEQAIAEAQRRADNQIPPGYRDARNPEPFGDYLVWKQTLLEAARQKISHLVFVTSDNKDDWYQIIKGKTVGARPELVRELMKETGAQLVMMNTTSFLFHAREYLDAEVSPETIRQSEVLPTSAQALDSRPQSEQRRQTRELEKLAKRVQSRQFEITVLEAAIADRLRTNPEDDSDEVKILRGRLQVVQRSERILAKRLNKMRASQLLDEDEDEDEEAIPDRVNVSRALESVSDITESRRAITESLEAAIADRLRTDPEDDSVTIRALRQQLQSSQDSLELLEQYLAELKAAHPLPRRRPTF